MAAGDVDGGGASDGMERVLILIEPSKGKRRPDDKLPEEIVLDRPRIVIGRSVKVDVQLVQGEGSQNTVSRKHAELRVEKGGAVKIEDLGSLNGLFVNRVKVLSAALQPGDLVQFGGAAGLKPGETLALPLSAANEQGEGAVVVGGSGNGVVYRFVERQLVVQQQPQQQERKKGGGGGGAKKRAAAAPPLASAASLVAASLVPAAVDGNGHGSSGNNGNNNNNNNNKRRKVEPKEEEGKEGEEGMGKLREEVKQLRAALVGATQGAEGIFKALGMPPRDGLNQAARAVERAMAALAKGEEERKKRERESKGRQQEAEEARKLKERVESLAQQLKARDAELLAAEARADSVEETGKQALQKAQALEAELTEQRATQAALAAQLEAAEKEKKELQAWVDEATAQCRELERAKASLQEELGKAHNLAAAAAAAHTRSSSGGNRATTSKKTDGPAASSSSTTSRDDILLSELRPELSCALCAGLLMDAAVLPCSHAFCFPCLHPRIHKKGGGGGGGGSDASCPICRERIPPPPFRPYRSTHLDTVVAIVAEALPAEERSEWEKREAATKRYYEKGGGEMVVCYGKKGEEGEEGDGLGMGGDSVISPTQKPFGGRGREEEEEGEGEGEEYAEEEEEEEQEDRDEEGEDDDEDSEGRVGW